MSSFPIGLILVSIVVFLSMGTEAWKLYLNLHAMVIVLGGTVAVFVMSSPVSTLKSMKNALKSVFTNEPDFGNLRGEFVELAERKRLSQKSNHELINYAAELWEQGVDPELFIVLISQCRDELEGKMLDVIQALKNLSKYPPALGMTGTVMGLVSLFSDLGKANVEKLGPSLALAMTATFFGLIVANCILAPMVDHLHVKHVRNERQLTNIYQVLLLINRNEAKSLVSDEVSKRAA